MGNYPTRHTRGGDGGGRVQKDTRGGDGGGDPHREFKIRYYDSMWICMRGNSYKVTSRPPPPNNTG